MPKKSAYRSALMIENAALGFGDKLLFKPLSLTIAAGEVALLMRRAGQGNQPC